MKSPPQPQRQARLHSQTRARSFVAPPTPKRLSAAVPRKSFVNDSSNKLTVEFLWDRFDELGPEQDWTLSQNVDTSRAMADVLVSRYKDRNVAGSILFAAVEYCAHIVDHEGVPDNWRRVRRSVEDIPLIMRAVFEAKADPTAEASHTKGRMRAMHYAAGLGTVPVLQALLEGTESVGEQAPGESVQSQIINVRSLNERNQEHYTPLHDAVWFKKYEATKWLLMHRADANAQNFMGWTPMHIVARQGTNLEFVRLLIDHGADLRRQDKAGDNPLMTAVNKPLFPVNKFHLLASSCYDQKSTFLAYLRDIYTLALENEQAAEEFVAVLLGRHHMGESAENDHQDTSTSDEDSDGQLKERPLRFMQSVDSATARSDQESDKALAMMAEVMEKAPRAAAMILDVLVGDPMVACPEHHPLPLRANMLIDGCEETMICDYQPDYFEEEDDTDEELSWVSRVANNNRKHIKRPGPGKRFEKRSANSGTSSTETDGGWESLRRNLLPKVQVVKNLEEEVYRHKCRLPCWRYDTLTNTGPEWHNSLAPMTEKRNDDKEVQIEVLKMPDLLDIKVIRVLAHTPHLDLFAEKTVQGIINCLWHQLVKHGVRSAIVLDIITLATLLAWIALAEVEEMSRVQLRSSFWLIITGTGIKELGFLSYSMYLCRALGRPVSSYLASMEVIFDIVATVFLIALALYTQEDLLVPRVGWARSVLALNVLMRWFQITYKCRPFSKVGKKIVCVLKSFMPMKEMMFITAVVFFGFAVAVLLIKDNDQMECDGHCGAVVLMNLFKALLMGDGDGFDDLTKLPGGDPSGVFAGVLVLLATLVFSVSVLNLLIAVYSNEYDKKEKQSDLLFFRERAYICFRHLMEPLWPTWRKRPEWLWRLWYLRQGQLLKPQDRLAAAETFVRLLVGGTATLLFLTSLLLAEFRVPLLPVAMVVLSMLIVQVAAKRCEWDHPSRNEGSQHFYLWICSRALDGTPALCDDSVSRTNDSIYMALRQMHRSMERQMGELKSGLQVVNERVDSLSREMAKAPREPATPPAQQTLSLPPPRRVPPASSGPLRVGGPVKHLRKAEEAKETGQAVRQPWKTEEPKDGASSSSSAMPVPTASPTPAGPISGRGRPRANVTFSAVPTLPQLQSLGDPVEKASDTVK